ncbi:MAG: NAD(P)H-dependent glycerol-3-phosphate dehydrogenase [Elusimicrobiota bacterium]
MVKKKNQYKIAVLGAGSWGITLANVLNDNKHRVDLWEFDSVQAKNLKKKRQFISLGDFSIPQRVNITNNLIKAVENKDFIVVSVPSGAVNEVAIQLGKVKDKLPHKIISTVKGFDPDSLQRPSQILRKYLGKKFHITVLSGPSHAEEVVNKTPTTVVAGSVDKTSRKKVQKLFSNIYFRVYTSEDIKGVELGGALKNVIAIGSGITKGLEMGDNTRAALITRGNAEITRLGTVLGARKHTFNGLSGIGDLIVTCFSEHSRNFRFGYFIGEGVSVKEALNKVNTTVEGFKTAKSCFKLSKKYNIKMPVSKNIYQILYKEKSAQKAWRDLMSRPLKKEHQNI